MNETTTMWAVHVQGPDDLHACPDRETADALALVLNGQFMRHSKPGDALMVATVTEWPYGYEAWRAESEQLHFVPVPAPAARAKPADLQGLRDALLSSGPVERDEDGYWCNDVLPCCDDGVDYAKLLAVFGLDAAIVFAESQMDVDAHEAMCETGGCTAWTPEPPEGDGWVMVSLHDTEDGAAAFYVRPAVSKP